MNKFLTVLLFLLAVLPVYMFSQSLEDVVYLKNGSIIRGIILEQNPNASLKIETKDGSVFVYKMSEVDKIIKEKSKNPVSTGSGRDLDSNPEKNFSIGVNPLGFLQFGPSVEAEIKIMPAFYLTGCLRWHGGGLLSYLTTTDLTANAFAFGGGARYYFRNPETPDAFFLGFQGQYGYGNVTGTKEHEVKSGTITSWLDTKYNGVFTYDVFAGEGGYRWRFNKMSVSIGALAGVESTLSSKYSFETEPSVMIENTSSLTSTFYAMLTLMIGTEF